MNKNMIIFLIASLCLIMGWQWALQKYYPATKTPVPAQAQATQSSKPSGQAAETGKPQEAAAAAEIKASVKASSAKHITVSTKAYVATLSSRGAQLSNLKLNGITMHHGGKIVPLDLVSDGDDPRFGTLQWPGVDLANLEWTLLTPQAVNEGGKHVLRFGAKVPGLPLELQKSFSFDPEKPQFELNVTVKNGGTQLFNLAPLALQWGPNLGGDSEGIGQFPPAGVVQLEGKIEREKANADQEVKTYTAPRWVALKNHYFVAGFFPQKGASAASLWNKAEIRRLGQGKVETALVADGISLAPGQSVELKTLVYAGAQEYEALKAFGNNFQAVLQFQYYQLFDWLNPLCVGLLRVMKWFHQVTGNWGVAIILLTLLVRGVMFYPSLKSMVSMRRMQTKMAAMQPRLETLKKVYKDDAQKLNAEMMKLYKEYGVNPLGGCLPMLLQIPIFFALYGTLSAAFELRGADFFWKWTDLTAGDPTYIFPIAMGVTMFLQQKLAPMNSATMSEEQAQMQKMMLWMMPIMFTGMALFMHWPMGLLLYWTASNIFGIAQQVAVNKTVS